MFRMHCQIFVERISRGEILEAVEWARRYLNGHAVREEKEETTNGVNHDMIDDIDSVARHKLSKYDEKLLLDTVGLLAYEVLTFAFDSLHKFIVTTE